MTHTHDSHAHDSHTYSFGDSGHSGDFDTLDLTGNRYVDSLLWSGNRLDSNVITYSFVEDESLDNDVEDVDTEDTDWSSFEREATLVALDTWSNVANISFVQENDDAADANFGFFLVTNADLGDGVLGRFGPPGEDNAGIGYFNIQGSGWGELGLQQGGLGFVTLIHELGHGLGLAHPHDNGGESSFFPGVNSPDDLGRNGQNQGIYTTMSYNDGLVDDGNNRRGFGYQGTPTAFDIAAIQYLYGANTSYNAGDDTYRLPTQNRPGTFYSTLWDADGTDTISARSSNSDTVINLKEAPLVGRNAGGFLSTVDGVYGGFTIANGVTIENAIAGSGNDIVIGNQANNRLKGGGGQDTLNGNQGDDDLIGMAGRDVLNGGSGEDRLVGGGTGDILNGGRFDDKLYGNLGRDVLSGGAGNDEMWGGIGRDTFLLEKGNGVDMIQDFDLNKDLLGLTRGVRLGAITVVQRDEGALIRQGGDRLATLIDVDASDITDNLFTRV